jgi:adenylyltransferase/sulfurtransferase
MNQDAVPEITATELNRRLGADDVPVLVDVREPHEPGIADLPQHGQVLIPTGEFMDRISELEPESEIVLYCRSGARSEWAAKLLLQAGFSSVLNLRGGVLSCRAEVDPTMQAY